VQEVQNFHNIRISGKKYYHVIQHGRKPGETYIFILLFFDPEPGGGAEILGLFCWFSWV